MARYTLYTGEPVMIGFMRTRPGPRFWSSTYALLTFFQVGWPGWALASATASAALVLGRMPDDSDAGLVRAFGYATFGASLLVLAFGRKTERNLEIAMWILLAVVFGYLLFVDLTMVSADSWRATASGFVAFGTLPAGADWLLLGAFAAFSGLGGMGKLMAVEFVTLGAMGSGWAIAGLQADAIAERSGPLFLVT
jgi:hypothetical protein